VGHEAHTSCGPTGGISGTSRGGDSLVVVKSLGGAVVLLGLLAMFLGTQLLETRELVGTVREECNTRLVDSVRDAREEAVVRIEAGYDAELGRLRRIIEANAAMVSELEQATSARERELRAARTALKEVAQSEPEDSCINATVPSAVWMRVRTD
jgi:hypothetical protein